MFTRLFGSTGMQISGGIILALAVALGLVTWRANTLSNRLDDARTSLAAEQTRHSVTRGSLTLLQGKMSDLVKAGKLRAEARDEALAEVAEETAALREEADNFDIKTVEGL